MQAAGSSCRTTRRCERPPREQHSELTCHYSDSKSGLSERQASSHLLLGRKALVGCMEVDGAPGYGGAAEASDAG